MTLYVVLIHLIFISLFFFQMIRQEMYIFTFVSVFFFFFSSVPFLAQIKEIRHDMADGILHPLFQSHCLEHCLNFENRTLYFIIITVKTKRRRNYFLNCYT